jgi:hypothetical protein
MLVSRSCMLLCLRVLANSAMMLGDDGDLLGEGQSTFPRELRDPISNPTPRHYSSMHCRVRKV